jgi:hypothetical protein
MCSQIRAHQRKGHESISMLACTDMEEMNSRDVAEGQWGLFRLMNMEDNRLHQVVRGRSLRRNNYRQTSSKVHLLSDDAVLMPGHPLKVSNRVNY